MLRRTLYARDCAPAARSGFSVARRTCHEGDQNRSNGTAGILPANLGRQDAGGPSTVTEPRSCLMPRRSSPPPFTEPLFDVTGQLRTAPCVPALRQAVDAWRRENYPGITQTMRLLLNYWFRTDHRLPTGQRFAYHDSQREAIETLIYVY